MPTHADITLIEEHLEEVKTAYIMEHGWNWQYCTLTGRYMWRLDCKELDDKRRYRHLLHGYPLEKFNALVAITTPDLDYAVNVCHDIEQKEAPASVL